MSRWTALLEWVRRPMTGQKAQPIDLAILRALDDMNATAWSGSAVSPATAMGIATVYSCVRFLSDSVSLCPPELFEWRGDSKWEQVAPSQHRVARLLDRPNPNQTQVEFWSMAMVHCLLRGAFFSHKVRNRQREVVQLVPFGPDMIDVRVREDGTPVYVQRDSRTVTRELERATIMHIRSFEDSPFVGMTPVQRGRQLLGTAEAQNENQGRMFANGVRLSGILSTDQTITAERRAVLEKAIGAWKSSKNSGAVPILDGGFKFQPLQMTMEDAQAIDAMRWSKEQISEMYGVPSFLLNSQSGAAWGAGLEQNMRAFMILTLAPWFERLAQRLAVELLQGEEYDRYFIRFNTRRFARADFKTQQEGLAIQRMNGIISKNEWREELGRPSIPDGDDYDAAAALVGRANEATDDGN